jgi:hypothetical protein
MKRLALMAVVAVACGGSPSGIAVNAAEYGSDWPFPGIASGTVECRPGSLVVFRAADGKVYGLNGSARGSGEFIDGLTITATGERPVPQVYGEFIERGLELCE